MIDGKLKVKSNYLPILDKLRLIQDISDAIHDSILYFGEKNLLDIVSPRKILVFEIEKKGYYKDGLALQTTKLRGDKA